MEIYSEQVFQTIPIFPIFHVHKLKWECFYNTHKKRQAQEKMRTNLLDNLGVNL